jgi:hypothetical protein
MASASEEERTASAEPEDTSANQEEAGGAANHEEGGGSADQEEGGGSADQEQGDGNQDEGGGDGNQDEGGGDQEEGVASGQSIASAIEDVSSLPGETVNDQDGRKIGQVKEIYAVGEDESPMWVTIESATGLGRNRQVFVPLARIKKQSDEIRVPYTFDHIHDSPEVEPGDEISEEDDRALRTYYAIGLADQELVESARSYASQVPDGEGSARKIDADSAEGPARELDDTPPAERVAEAYEKQKEEEGEEHRKGRGATAEDVFEEDGNESGGEKSDGDESDDEKSESDESDGEKSHRNGSDGDKEKDEEG